MTTREEHMASPEFQERRQRDSELTRRIQDGFVPAEWDGEGYKPLVTDGQLSEDASEALGELYRYYEGLIHGVSNEIYAKLGRPPGLTNQDIDQEGFYGLFRAALNWKPENTPGGFTGYARTSITRYAMRKAREVSTTVYLPHNARDRVARYRAAFWQSYSTEEHVPRRRRIASWLGVAVEQVDEIAAEESIALQMGSVDRGYFEDDREQHSTHGTGEGHWKSIFPEASGIRGVEDEVIINTIQEIVGEALDNYADKGLNHRAVEVIRLRYFGFDGVGEPLTLEEIAHHFGVTRERIRQIEVRALAKLRRPDRREVLENLLDQ